MKKQYTKILLIVVSVLFMTGCSIPVQSPFQKAHSIPSTKVAGLDKKVVFDAFLAKVKILLADLHSSRFYGTKPYPKVFISYAWEDERVAKGKVKNKKLQERLMKLQEDLECLGIETFIDMKYMQGNMRQTMKQNLEAADFVIVIGTPCFKKKALQDHLSVVPYFDPRSIPQKGNHLIMVELREAYVAYYLEEGEVKDIITIPLAQAAELLELSWIAKPNAVKEATLSERTNDFLEILFAKLKARPIKRVSNVQFELGIALDRAQKNSKMLIPLIIKGDHTESFPKVMQNNFIRDFRSEDHYYLQMSSLSSPLGILPVICPELMRNRDYANLLNDFKKAMKDANLE